MRDKELLEALQKVATQDQLRCLGCGHEHNCGIHGCAVIKQAERRLRECFGRIGKLQRQLKRAHKERENLLEEIERLRWEKQAAQDEIVARWERGGN